MYNFKRVFDPYYFGFTDSFYYKFETLRFGFAVGLKRLYKADNCNNLEEPTWKIYIFLGLKF